MKLSYTNKHPNNQMSHYNYPNSLCVLSRFHHHPGTIRSWHRLFNFSFHLCLPLELVPLAEANGDRPIKMT